MTFYFFFDLRWVIYDQCIFFYFSEKLLNINHQLVRPLAEQNFKAKDIIATKDPEKEGPECQLFQSVLDGENLLEENVAQLEQMYYTSGE